MSRGNSKEGAETGVSIVAATRDALTKADLPDPMRLLVAFSGGADSTALLLAIHEIALAEPDHVQLEIAHFNHQLRAERSNSDELSCRELCEDLGITLHTGSGYVAGFAEKHGESVEAAARHLRYRFLAEIASERKMDAVVTGHTLDDQAETVILAMTRGAGLSGISGMALVTQRHDLGAGSDPLIIVRPMLGLRRADTVTFCESRGVQPLEDESNRDTRYARNRVRLNVIPELEKVNPSVVEAIGRLADIARADHDFILEAVRKTLQDIAVDETGGISRTRFSETAPTLQPHVLAYAYTLAAGSSRDLDMQAINSCLDAIRDTGTGSLDLANGVTFVLEHDVIRFLPPGADPACPYPAEVGEHILEVPGNVSFSDGSNLSARIVSPVPDLAQIGKWQALIARDEAVLSLTVRARRDGDRVQPLGMAEQVKLQDFLVNQHVPARWRDRVPLVLANDQICWVAGERIADWAKVSSGASEAVLLEYTPADDSSGGNRAG